MSDPKMTIVIPENYNGTPVKILNLTGEAPANNNPVSFDPIQGDIKSVTTFLANDETRSNASLKKAIVIANYAYQRISLDCDPNDKLAYHIVGFLKKNADLEGLNINKSGTEYSLTDLRKLLRFSGLLFANRTQHAELMKKLESVRVRFEQEIQDDTDGKGNHNKSDRITTQIDSGLTEPFDLLCPIFEGHPPLKFRVEIVFSGEGRKLTCWFESVELKELTDTETKRILNEEISAIKRLGYTVIEQY